MTQQAEALRLLEEALKELESPKGSVLAAIQKLSRASALVEQKDTQIWCAIQLGDSRYTDRLTKLINAAMTAKDIESHESKKLIGEALQTLAPDLKIGIHCTQEELNVKAPASGGGYISIGFVEEKYADLVRRKTGNDGTYYKNNLYKNLNFVRRKAHDLASALFNQLKFEGTVSNSFDVLKSSVDDKLLDLNPALAEQLMVAFRSVSSASNEEHWSQALTTCRRLLEGVADELHPVSTEESKGRGLSQAQYVNRLWAFMDKSIGSQSNKELAKAHVDFLGSWLEKTNKVTNKGVHAEVGRLEAVKAVFHTYLVIADVLEYLQPHSEKRALDINSATMDELRALLDISRTVAKEIIKARVQHGKLDKALLSKIAGVGPKTVERAVAVFSL